MRKIAFGRSLVVVATLALSAPLYADIIKCVFTEPFYSTTYSMAQQSLTIEAPGEPTTVLRNVSFQIRGPAHFEIMHRDRHVIQTLDLNNAGSDGMSDRTYPFEVLWHDIVSGANRGIGGCWSNFLPAIETPSL